MFAKYSSACKVLLDAFTFIKLVGWPKTKTCPVCLPVSEPDPSFGAPNAQQPIPSPAQTAPPFVPPPTFSPTQGQSPATPAADAQATLLALLTQAANVGSVVPTFPYASYLQSCSHFMLTFSLAHPL